MGPQAYSVRKRRRSLGRVLGPWPVTLLLAVGAIVVVGPFYWTVITSFKPASEVLVFPPTWWPRQPTVQGWLELTKLKGGGILGLYRNSLLVTSIVTSLVLLTSAMAGYVFAKFQFFGRTALFILVLSMLMIPGTATIIPLYALMVRLHWNNSYWALIVPSAVSPFGIFLLHQFIHSIPSDLIDAARIDGSSEFGIFFRIILPLSTAALGALGIFTFMWNWDDFLWPLIVLDDPRIWTLPVGLSTLRSRFGSDIGATLAGASAAVIPVIIIYLLAQRHFVEGLALTGMKG